jgi:hypothetical protein
MTRVNALLGILLSAFTVCMLMSCEEDAEKVLLTSETNMQGHRHDLHYNGDTLASITHTSFITHSETDTAQIDTVIRRDVDSLIYEPDGSVGMLRSHSRHSASGKVHRKFYFNSDNLLLRITRFSGTAEYTTDSMAYDYTGRKAFFYDLVNKEVNELEYDRQENIASILVKRMSSEQVISSVYNYYTTSRNPYLINLADGEKLFGCFHRESLTLYWYGGSRPQFHSVNNVQAYKQIRNNKESNALFEYQLRDGLPIARYGGDGVIFFRYAAAK